MNTNEGYHCSHFSMQTYTIQTLYLGKSQVRVPNVFGLVYQLNFI